MKSSILAIGTLALCLVAVGPVASATEVDDAYQKLKDAQTAKDTDAIKKWAIETAKLAKAEAAGPKLDTFSDADWPKRVEFDKGVVTLCEYALAASAAQAGQTPQKTVELMDALLEINPKSTYIGTATSAYLAALGKMGGTEKQTEGAQKIVNGSPNEEEALTVLADNLMARNRPDQAFTYATRLVNVMRTKAKPEGVSEEDWNRRKSLLLSRGYYTAGVTGCMRQIWKDCDTNLRAALPLLGGQTAMTGPAYFYLGVANYQISKITTDRTKLQEALKFTQQSAAIAGPLQGQAQQYVNVMQNELRQPIRR
ncbi:MAG: tetratricopeptide repeat protein [Deltaproteobacteria bacterium]